MPTIIRLLLSFPFFFLLSIQYEDIIWFYRSRVIANMYRVICASHRTIFEFWDVNRKSERDQGNICGKQQNHLLSLASSGIVIVYFVHCTVNWLTRMHIIDKVYAFCEHVERARAREWAKAGTKTGSSSRRRRCNKIIQKRRYIHLQFCDFC